MKETEKVEIMHFDQEGYLADGKAAVEAGDKAAAAECLKKAERALTMAASKGVFHKNTSSRKVSRLSKAVDGIQ